MLKHLLAVLAVFILTLVGIAWQAVSDLWAVGHCLSLVHRMTLLWWLGWSDACLKQALDSLLSLLG